MARDRKSPLAVVTACGESSALHFIGGEGDVTVLVLHANGFCGRMYEPLVARSSLSKLAKVYALDMPRQGSSPKRETIPGEGRRGALQSYAPLALAAVEWLRRDGRLSGSSPLCALGHSGGGLAAVGAEQARPGTFRALYLYEPVVLTSSTPSPSESESTSSPLSRPFALSSTPSLVASARRRRREFASREAAAASLRKKPPMSSFDDECLRTYTEEGMVSVDRGKEGRGGGGKEEASPSSTAVALAASPEDEADVYLEAGALGVEAGRKLALVSAPVLVAAGGGGGGRGGSGSDADNSDLHEPLARAATRTASALPRGKLEVYRGLGHLGPFEDPGFVGERAAEAFRRALGAVGANRRCRCSWCRARSGGWDSLPDEAELESTGARSKL